MSALQPVVIVPQTEWIAVLARLEAGRSASSPTATSAEGAALQAPTYLTSAQAAARLGVKPEAIRRAHRRRQLAAVQLDERSYGFRQEDLDQYVKRYHRQKP